MTTSMSGDPSKAFQNPATPCGSSSEINSVLLGEEVVLVEMVVEAETSEDPDHVIHSWRAPDLGCATLQSFSFRRYSDGTRSSVMSVVPVKLSSGVPDDVFVVDPTWEEVSPGTAHVRMEAHWTSPEEAELWRSQPNVQQFLQRIDDVYYRNRALAGID